MENITTIKEVVVIFANTIEGSQKLIVIITLQIKLNFKLKFAG